MTFMHCAHSCAVFQKALLMEALFRLVLLFRTLSASARTLDLSDNYLGFSLAFNIIHSSSI